MRTTLIWIVAAVLIVAVVAAAIPSVVPWAKSKLSDASRTLENNISDASAAEMFEEELSKEGQRLRERYKTVYSIKMQIARHEAALKSSERERSYERKVITRANQLLKTHNRGDMIMVGGSTLSWDGLNTDSLKHLATCKVLDTRIQNETAILADLENGYQAAQAEVLSAQENLRQMKLQFEIERAELAALRAREEVRALLTGISGSGGISKNIQVARKIWNDKLDGARAGAEFDALTGTGINSGSVRTWDIELGISRELASPAIEAYLSGETEAAEPELLTLEPEPETTAIEPVTTEQEPGASQPEPEILVLTPVQ